MSNVNYSNMSISGKNSFLMAILGIFIYALFSFQLTFPPNFKPYGINIYDQYYLAVLQGRLDLKAIVLQYEGHYLPDGTGYLYHGIAPLVTRFAFGWLVDLQHSSLAAFSIWLWACVGSVFYHLTFYKIIIKFSPKNIDMKGWAITFSLLCWFATPGILIAANIAFYHEVISIAYAGSAIFVYFFSRFCFHDLPLNKAIIPLSLMAAIVLHARPNLAIGFYVGVVLLCLFGIWKFRRKMLLSVSLAIMILGFSGLGYIGINILKFGDASVSHGSFTSSEVQYGTAFWGGETPENSERAKAFYDYGKFNIKRILPNFLIYTFDPPFYVIGIAISEKLENVFQSAIKPSLGFIRLEGPRTGILFLWLGWISIITYGLVKSSHWNNLKKGSILLIATSIAYFMTLSYGTVTLRYRFDMWPLFASLALLILPVVVKDFYKFTEGWRRVMVILLVGISLQATLKTAYVYTHYARERPGSFFESWTEARCKKIVEINGFEQARADELCRL